MSVSDEAHPFKIMFPVAVTRDKTTMRLRAIDSGQFVSSRRPYVVLDRHAGNFVCGDWVGENGERIKGPDVG